jgi:anti-anti-sigma factor
MTGFPVEDMKTKTIQLRSAARLVPPPDTVTVGPRFDAASVKSFTRDIGRIALRREPTVIIDMSKTKAVSSSGFGSLMSALRKLADAGSAVVVVSPSISIRRLFDFAGIARMVTVVDSLSAARSVGQTAQPGRLAS